MLLFPGINKRPQSEVYVRDISSSAIFSRVKGVWTVQEWQ